MGHRRLHEHGQDAPWHRNVHRKFHRQLKHAFVPHAGNNFQPHVLRPTALSIYAVVVLVAKLAVTALLFAVYPNPAFFSSATAGRFLELTNTARTEADLKPLAINEKLTRAAERKAEDILAQDYFAHTNPQGKKFWQWLKEAGYRYAAAGENLALDFADADIAHQALMASRGHRANLLNNRYTQVGFAVKTGTFKGRTTTVLVEMFGRPAPLITKPVARAAEQEKGPKPSPPAVPDFLATLTSLADLDVSLAPGQVQAVTVSYRNDGAKTWQREGREALFLEAVAPVDRQSPLAQPSWPSPNRAAVMAPETVTPGEIGRWVFSLGGPAVSGVYAERFALRQASGVVLDGTEVTFIVHVAQPVQADPPPVPAPTATSEPSPPDGETSELLTPSGDVQPVAPARAAPSAAEVTPSLLTFVRGALKTSNTLFLFLLAFLTVALLVNVVVRYEVQHRHIIVGTLILIVFTAAMLVFGFHFLELAPLARPLIV